MWQPRRQQKAPVPDNTGGWAHWESPKRLREDQQLVSGVEGSEHIMNYPCLLKTYSNGH